MAIPYTVADWKGYEKHDFEVGGRFSTVILPKKALPGNPWVWRTEFLGAFDCVDMALLEKGWHVAYHKVSDMYGCPQSLAWMREFQQVVEKEYGLAPLPALFGFSRGGLYAVNYAHTYPEKVGLLYLDAPVLDIRNWPITTSNEKERNDCLHCFRITMETLPDFRGCPIDYAPFLAGTDIPILIVAGGEDKVVWYGENTAVFEKRYKEAGGRKLLTIVKPHCDHHPHSLEEPDIAVSYIEANILK